GRDYTLPKITIDRSRIAGFAVSTDAYGSTSPSGQSVGYQVTGTQRDGLYMDASHSGKNFKIQGLVDESHPWPNLAGVPTDYARPGDVVSVRSTPWSCLSPGGSGCGRGASSAMTYFMTRGFKISDAPAKAKRLPDPLWLLAKYGGFKDYNHNGVPDPGEWEKVLGNPESGPANHYTVRNAGDIPWMVDDLFKSISSGQTYGTGTSSQIVSESAGGLSIQTLFYPRYSVPAKPDNSLPFVGSVFALFLDQYGNLREDTDLDKMLTTQSSNGRGDRIATFTTRSLTPESPPPCYDQNYYISLCDDPTGRNMPELAPGRKAHPDSFHQLKAVWDAGRWLMELDSPNASKLGESLRDWSSAATQRLGKRRIYFGYRDAGLKVTQMPLNLKANSKQISSMMFHDNYKDYFPGRGSKAMMTEEIVKWVLGKDYDHLRQRGVPNPWRGQGYSGWRLGDVMNSKPVAVGVPKSNFDFLYKDVSYAKFKSDNADRRIMVYFGANDGMLHAVNAGFFSGSGDTVSYSVESKSNPAALPHDLGAELWAYIPASAMPTLPFLADPGYLHNYYVDLKPLLVDLKIKGEWRTLLIGGMRLGGRPIDAPSEDANTGQPYFAEVFCFDVTDPETEPRLMWTYSSLELGLMVGLPVSVRNGDKFYVMLPTGPVTDSVESVSKGVYDLRFGGRSPYYGVSRQNARIIVLDAETGVPVVNPEKDPDYLTASEPQSFFSGAFLPEARHDGRGHWSDHAAYFGLTETSLHGSGRDGGSLWRVRMADDFGDPLPPQDWKLARMLDTGRPITGTVNATRDEAERVWVVFGTGRLYGEDDVSPCESDQSEECRENHEQYIFGLREPVSSRGFMTFEDLTPKASTIVDVSGAMVLNTGEVLNLPVQAGFTGAGGAARYVDLESATRHAGTIGWKKRLDSILQRTGVSIGTYEMVVTQPKLMSMGGGKSLMAFTSFRPGADSCSGFGEGFLHVADTFTGLPSPGTYPMFTPVRGGPMVPKGLVSGVAALGVGNPTEATIITARGKTIIRAASSDGGLTDLEFQNTSGNSSSILIWREVTDTGFTLSKEAMVLGLSDD
ncbi:MAG: hypothetical protein LBQ12_07155, partial [Deltaproteobacteria bacterium]|nr:hypothetical protein [Deltaproteobacteria bacterium]